MKKVFIGILIFFIVLNVVMPLAYYIMVGEVHVYSELFDWPALSVASLCNVLDVGIAILLLLALPEVKKRVAPVIVGNGARHVFYFSILFRGFYDYVSGGIQGVFDGNMNGTVLNYINIVLNPTLLISCIFLLEKSNRKIYYVFAAYALEATIAGSRGAIMILPLMLIIGGAFEGFDAKRAQVWRILKIAIPLAPLVFLFATALRTSTEGINFFGLMGLVVARLSSLELAMIPIYHIGSPTVDWNLFFEKYGFISQAKGMVNSISLIKPFEPDILPNGYFGAIFFGQTDEYARANYSSTPVTLPVFLYLYFGAFGGVVFVGIILLYYTLSKWIMRFPIVCVILSLQVYPLLIFFDWVSLFKIGYSLLLTALILSGYLAIRRISGKFL